MTADEAARRLRDYIRSLADFVYREVDEPYNHIGATIADAVLQPQREYNSFVTPKTDRILAKWPNVKTVTQLVELLESVRACDFLDWNDKEGSQSWLAHRVQRFCNLVYLFKSEGIETEGDLKAWLSNDSNLSKLYAVWGVGQKTVNYLGILVNLPWVAIDSRLSSFLRAAEISFDPNDFSAQRDIVCRAADLLEVDRRVLDHSIWRYMDKTESSRNTNEGASKRSCRRLSLDAHVLPPEPKGVARRAIHG